MSKLPTELSPATLIKRVMSGKKEYRSEDYLKAFSQISSNDLHVDTYITTYKEVIKLWNSLQSTPNKVCYFTFALTQRNSEVIKKVEEYYANDKYAYILHDKDKGVEHRHYHYLLMFKNPRSFASIANDLEIPVTMLQKVWSKKGILNYLTHDNSPDKHHYSLEEIHSNFDIDMEKKISDSGGSPEFMTTFKKYCDLHEGRITKHDFAEYVNMYCATLRIDEES